MRLFVCYSVSECFAGKNLCFEIDFQVNFHKEKLFLTGEQS